MKKLILILFISFSISQEMPWGGVSVANSDNLDALSINPAGLGVQRGNQAGLALFNIAENNTVHLANRDGGFGSTFRLENSDSTSENFYSLGLGFELGSPDVLGGVQWFSEQRFRLGTLVRPMNFLSVGLTADYNKKTEDWDGLKLGTAVRPIGSKVTFGADLNSNGTDFDNIHTSYFAEVLPMDGLKVGLSYGDDELRISVGFNFGVADVYFSSQGSSSSGFGTQKYSQNRPTMFEIKKKKKLAYVNMKLNGMFIEEPVTRKSFRFDFPDIMPAFLGGGKPVKKIQLRKWIDAVDRLTEDESINGMVIHLERIGGGFAQLTQAREALNRFKGAGKTLIVYATGISNASYYFISMADEIYIPDLSSVDLRGLMIEVRFFKDLLDSLNIVAEVEQVSPYKSAMDPFIRSSMSDEMRENYTMLFDDIYTSFVNGIANGKGWSVDKTKNIIDEGPYSTKNAIDAGLITDSKYPDEFKKYMKMRDDEEIEYTKFIEFGSEDNYVYDWVEEKEKIAVIYAVGGINVGKSEKQGGVSNIMGNETIANAIISARKDKDVKAIVMRINSGGGSALASDLIWKEVWNTTVSDSDNVKPFIASMSNVAASGGYYIACQADTIVADSTTITGSIGVIAGRINLSGLWENKLFTHTDQLKFGEHSDLWEGSRLWSEEERLSLRQEIIDIYGTFLSRVAGGREALDSLDVHEVGIGKVWSGVEAKRLGLVDELGGLHRSIDIAKEAAGIDLEGDVIIEEYPRTKPFNFKLMFNRDDNAELLVWKGPLGEIKRSMDALPNFQNDRMQMILPYEIIIK